MNTDEKEIIFEQISIPPDPEERFFNCKLLNQTALANEVFWIVDYDKVEMNRDNKVSEKYVQKCFRNLGDGEELTFKFFTGCKTIKYKLDYIRNSEKNDFPVQVKLTGGGRSFDIEILQASCRKPPED